MGLPPCLPGKQGGPRKTQEYVVPRFTTFTSSSVPPVHYVCRNIPAPFLPGTGTRVSLSLKPNQRRGSGPALQLSCNNILGSFSFAVSEGELPAQSN